MRFTPRALSRGEAVLGGSLFALLLVCCAGLLACGRVRGLWYFAGLCLAVAGAAYSRLLSGVGPGIYGLLEKVHLCTRLQPGAAAQRNGRHRSRSEVVAIKLRHLEEQVEALVELRVDRRLDELQRQERWRTRTEYSELRDVWRNLLGDPSTPETVRQACQEWLARYPETLDFLARRLIYMGLLWEQELSDNWEEHEVRKYRVQ